MHVITATGARPEGLAMLAGYLSAQTYAGPIHWIVCDDCDPATPVRSVRDGITVDVIRPDWRWHINGGNTLARSMLALLERVPVGAPVVVMEDDDLYLPGHLANMADALQTAELVGEQVARYYNVRSKRYKAIPGAYHASLAATALKGAALDRLREVCLTARHLDMELWRTFSGKRRLLNTANVIGIKGLPGRGGIGVGHRPDFGTPDPDGSVMREWLGNYADNYRGFA